MLASRLGVALLIVLGITTYVANRPIVGAHVGDPRVVVAHSPDDADVMDGSDDGTRLRIGPLSIETDPEVMDAVRDSLESLEESELVSEEELALIKETIKFKEIEMHRIEAESEAMENAGREIVQHFVAQSPEPQNDRPDRLSEDEIQSLVVERLLSVQSQMRSEDAAVQGSNSDGPADVDAPEVRDFLFDLNDVIAEMPEAPVILPAAPNPAASAATPPESAPASLERIEGDFAGENLMGTDFRNRDLSGLDFSNAKLTAAKFDGSDLSGADLSGARIQGASFVGTLMVDTLLNNAQAQTANFHHANLVGADLTQANFAGAVLTQADMRGVKMTDINLNGAVMDGTKMGDRP